MTRNEYLALLSRALTSPHGIALDFDGWQEAERARRRIYSVRDSRRRAGDDSFDTLSLVQQPEGRLLIVRRDRLPRGHMEDGIKAEARPISREELPDRFGYCNFAFTVNKPK